MNYLRSAVVLASVSIVALVAGCNDGSDVTTTDDTTPNTAVREKGLDTQASGAGICVQDLGGTDKDAIFFQVQASRVSKYLFGGNDPFDTTGAGDSPEYGAMGTKQPDLGNPECAKAADIVHTIHDKLYPASPEKCGRETMQRTKDGLQCTPPAATASITGGGLSIACNLPADTFGFAVSTADTDWVSMRDLAPLLDGCWGKGLSGFWWTKEGVIAGGQKDGARVNIVGTDPEPADLKAPLAGGSGATAAAIYTNTGLPTQAILWPGTYASGGTAAAGTPCSTYGLAPGDRTSKQIVVTGSLRKCM